MAYKSIQEWYSGKNIFITGATGYMGKVLIEKILRSIPSVNKIYILIRSKREQSPAQRIASFEKLPLFGRIMEECPAALKKIVPIIGDLSEDDLGISQKDRDLLNEQVSIIFHLGATLKLEANVKDAIKLNTEGTLTLLKLAKHFKKLEVFVHVSTAFCYCDMPILGEKVYPPTQNPYEMIELCREKSVDEVNAVESLIMPPHPNSYVFSKRLAEAVVHDMRNEIPIVIARPSIVLPTAKEPFPGWVDSLNGPIGVVVAAGKGVLRTMYCDQNSYLKVIPVDIAANAFIDIAYARANVSPEKTVYNVTSGNVLTYNDIIRIGQRLLFKYPFEWTVWYPSGQPTNNRFIHNLMIIFCHYLPAYFIDFLLLLFMQKRFMIRVQNKISFGLKLLEYFTTRNWIFLNDNGLDLESHLSKEDARTFPLASCLNINPDKYMEDALYGARTYCMKESLKTLPFCRIYMKFLYCLHILTKVILYYYVLKLFLTLLGASYLLTPIHYIQLFTELKKQ